MDFWQEIINDINSAEITTTSSIYKMFVSLVLGAVVGYERKRRGQSAGVRTFSLISMGAALAMILSIYVPQLYTGSLDGDPTRIAAQVVTGIGFLGAGAIIQMKGSVRGLTTAAGIWMVASIGMAVGAGMYWLSLIATLLILFILVQLERIERKVSLGRDSRIIRIQVGSIVSDIDPYRKTLTANNAELQSYLMEYDYEMNQTRLNLVIISKENVDYIKLLKELSEVNPTKTISVGKQISI